MILNGGNRHPSGLSANLRWIKQRANLLNLQSLLLQRGYNAVVRYRFAIAALVLLLAAIPVLAQRGGGGRAGGFGGGHANFSGGHFGGFAGHSGFSGGHFAGGHSTRVGGPAIVGLNSGHPFHSGFSRGPFLHNGFNRFNNGFRGNRFHNRFRNCFGFNCWGGYGYPWWGAGYIDPWWWWDSGSNYDEDYERDRAAAEEMNERSIEEQRMLRQEEMDGDQDAYARRPHPPMREQETQQEKEPAAMLPATVLVFRDQHKQEVQNYAIVGQTLWAFAPQHQKIPLADLDLQATAKANEDRGVSFHVPGSNEGQ